MGWFWKGNKKGKQAKKKSRKQQRYWLRETSILEPIITPSAPVVPGSDHIADSQLLDFNALGMPDFHLGEKDLIQLSDWGIDYPDIEPLPYIYNDFGSSGVCPADSFNPTDPNLFLLDPGVPDVPISPPGDSAGGIIAPPIDPTNPPPILVPVDPPGGVRFDFKKSDQPLVGIIDTGFGGNNPDIDYSNITLGRDYIDNDANPLLQNGEGNEHGTHILGVIAAKQDNGIGIDGINNKAPIWVSRATGSGKWADSLVEFSNYAKQSGQPNAVVNLSLDLTQVNPDGSVTTRYEFTPQERSALEYARQNHVLIVASAGNDGGVMSVLGQASQEFDNIITVGSADGMQRAGYSSYGYGLDVMADGGRVEHPVLSTVGDGVGTMAGTSVAAAKVTGAVSQVWAANPGLNYRQVIDILEKTAKDLNAPSWDAETGFGLVDIEKAVELAKATEPQEYKPKEILIPSAWSGEGKVTPNERAVSGGNSITSASVQSNPNFSDSDRVDVTNREKYYQINIDQPGYLRYTVTRTNGTEWLPSVELFRTDGKAVSHEFSSSYSKLSYVGAGSPGGGGDPGGAFIAPVSDTNEMFVDSGTYYFKVNLVDSQQNYLDPFGEVPVVYNTTLQHYNLASEFIPDRPASFSGSAQFRTPSGVTASDLNDSNLLNYNPTNSTQPTVNYWLDVNEPGNLSLKISSSVADRIVFQAKKLVGLEGESGAGEVLVDTKFVALDLSQPIELNNLNKGRYLLQAIPRPSWDSINNRWIKEPYTQPFTINGVFFPTATPSTPGSSIGGMAGGGGDPGQIGFDWMPQNLQFNVERNSYKNDESVRITGRVYDSEGTTNLDKIYLEVSREGGETRAYDITNFTPSSSDNRWAEFAYNLGILPPGNYKITARAFDKSGGVSDTVIQSNAFQVTAPNVPGEVRQIITQTYQEEWGLGSPVGYLTGDIQPFGSNGWIQYLTGAQDPNKPETRRAAIIYQNGSKKGVAVYDNQLNLYEQYGVNTLGYPMSRPVPAYPNESWYMPFTNGYAFQVRGWGKPSNLYPPTFDGFIGVPGSWAGNTGNGAPLMQREAMLNKHREKSIVGIGVPVGNVDYVPGGYMQRFRNPNNGAESAIFAPNGSNEAYFVLGEIWKAYQSEGGIYGGLGFPRSDEIGQGEVYTLFDNGRIEWSESLRRTRIVYNDGRIRDIWQEIPSNQWKAEFFNNRDLADHPVLVENWGDGSQGFLHYWGNGAPSGLSTDNFSARITTRRYFAPGIYQINSNSDDGVRVKIGDQTVIDKWVEQGFNNQHGGYFRSDGGEYPVTVEYFESGGDAALNLNISQEPIQPPFGNYDSNLGSYLSAIILGDTVKFEYEKGYVLRYKDGSVSPRYYYGSGTPSQPVSNSEIKLVNFSGFVMPTIGVALRNSPRIDDKSGKAEAYRKSLSFDAWTYGETVNDYKLGTPDARWFRIAGTNYWVPSAYINGNPPNSTPMPGGSTSSGNTQPQTQPQPNPNPQPQNIPKIIQPPNINLGTTLIRTGAEDIQQSIEKIQQDIDALNEFIKKIDSQIAQIEQDAASKERQAAEKDKSWWFLDWIAAASLRTEAYNLRNNIVQLKALKNAAKNKLVEYQTELQKITLRGTVKNTPDTQANNNSVNLKVERGQVTFDAEGNDDPNSPYYSRKAHWPGSKSGVTIGRGYDLGFHTESEILKDFQYAGISIENAKKFSQAAQKIGNEAKQFLDQHKEKLPEITEEQEKRLFKRIYLLKEDEFKRISGKQDVVDKYGTVDWSKLNPAILDIAVDLIYRGDYTPDTRKVVQPLIVKNDLKGLLKTMSDQKFWVSVPPDRFQRRIDYLKKAVSS